MNPTDLRQQLPIAERPLGWLALAVLVRPIRRPGDLQHTADRLDPETVTMLINEPHQFLGSRGSSPRQKSRGGLQDLIRPAQLPVLALKRLDPRRLSARRSGRRPPSTSTCLTHLRSVSAVIPNFPAIELIAAHCDSYSCPCSSTNLTARSRTSRGYGLLFPIGQSSSKDRTSKNPGAVQYGCYTMFGLSLVAALIIITMIWSRLAHFGSSGTARVPTLWIVLGPLGQSITAAGLLGATAHLAVPSELASSMNTFAVLYGVPVFGFALFWGALAASLTVRTIRRGLPFALTW